MVRITISKIVDTGSNPVFSVEVTFMYGKYSLIEKR